ncbi:MAG: serpin family protein [Muribaculaceae bacterium]|nr:serpin family protein [Muribaculaceae bacterium]
MNTTKKLMTLLLAMLALAACKDDGEVVYMLPETKPIQLSAEQKQMRDNNNEFAWRLFQTMQEQKGDSSTVISPIGVTYMLGMLNTGAAGTTRDEITNVLGFGNDPQAVNEYCKKMIDEAPNVDPAATVRIANSIYVNSAKGLSLLKQYVNDMKNYYSAQIDALDFTKSGTLDKINNWCSKNTGGMIPSILDEINPNAAMYLLNAIYFNADWTEKFDKNDTRNSSFTLPDGSVVTRELMHRKAIAQGCESELCSMLRIPFGSGGYSMYVMLPAEGKSTSDLIRDMSQQALSEHLNAIDMTAHEVDILMPRFEIVSDIDLKRVLKPMGIQSAFTPNADFSNMSNVSLFVTMMKQKAKIEVDEDGAKASAVTISGMEATSPGPQLYEKAEFHANRPFLYFILEENTRSIFFIGTYCGN